MRSFFKTDFQLSQTLFQKKFFNFSLSIWLGQGLISIFCRFRPFFLQGFPLPRLVSPFYPSFCIFHVSCINSWFLGKFSNLCKIEISNDSSQIFWNWSMGFCSWMLWTWSWWFNLINLLNFEKLKFLGLVCIRIGDFVQLGPNW